MDKNLLLGSMINNYEIIGQIGQGGMGTVYLAQHPHIGKKVAIKLLRAESSKNPELAQRFFQEAEVVGLIRHQNLVDVLDFGQTAEGECYLIMEYLEGETLTALIQREELLPLTLIGHLGLQLCAVLSAAHSKGVIHRDLKSDNVFLVTRDSTENFVKLFDFGIAKLLDHSLPLLTMEGMTMGTPMYMSPEQATGRPLNGQTDIYALGVLLYYLATKTYPFVDANPLVVANMQVHAPLPRPSERLADIDPRLELVIVRCLEKDQGRRYSSMQEVAAALGLACDLEVAPYFGQKRGPGSREFRVPTPTAPSAKLPALQLFSERIEPQPKTRRSHGVALLAAVAVALFVLFGGWGGTSTAPPLEATPIQEPSVVLLATNPATKPNAAPKATPATKNAQEPKKTRRPGVLKKLQSFFNKK